MSDKVSANVLVVDLDDTLFIHSFRTRLFFRISRLFHKLALRSVRLNRDLAEDIRGRRVIIMTGRNLDGDKEVVEAQLRRHKVEYESILLCPRMKLTMDWKRRELDSIEKKYGSYFWIDDMK